MRPRWFAYDASVGRRAPMSYDSARGRGHETTEPATGRGGVPGKRSQTDRMTAPAGAMRSTAHAESSPLSGTAWLDGLLGFTTAHDPSGECRCAGCTGRARGFSDTEQ